MNQTLLIRETIPNIGECPVCKNKFKGVLVDHEDIGKHKDLRYFFICGKCGQLLTCLHGVVTLPTAEHLAEQGVHTTHDLIAFLLFVGDITNEKLASNRSQQN